MPVNPMTDGRVNLPRGHAPPGNNKGLRRRKSRPGGKTAGELSGANVVRAFPPWCMPHQDAACCMQHQQMSKVTGNPQCQGTSSRVRAAPFANPCPLCLATKKCPRQCIHAQAVCAVLRTNLHSPATMRHCNHIFCAEQSHPSVSCLSKDECLTAVVRLCVRHTQISRSSAHTE